MESSTTSKLESFKSSFSYQKTFVEKLFTDILVSSTDNINKLLQISLNLIEILEFPFVLILNNNDYMDKFGSIYFEENFADLIEKLIKACIKKFDFENSSYSSIECILKFADIMGMNTNYDQRMKGLTHLETIYLEFFNLLTDCQFLKSYLDENANEIDLKDIIIRIKSMKKNELNVSVMNYPVYILDFVQEMTTTMTEYEDFFTKKSNEGEKYENVNQKIIRTKDVPIDPKSKTSFYLEERLQVDEGMNVEYKNYRWPFPDNMVDILKNQICGFLNAQGGRIYIGVSDEKLVKGISLTPKNRDTARNEIANYTRDFFPKCRTNKIEVLFVPVKKKRDESYIPNLWVIKVIVKQGDVDKLYSMTPRGFFGYMRMPGQCVQLSAEEITDEIVKRKTNPKNPIDEKEFVDIPPEVPLDVDDDIGSNNSALGKKNNINRRIEPNVANKNNLKDSVTLFVKGIPSKADKNSVLNVFKECNYISEKIFTEKDGSCKGWAYFNFQTESDAKKALNITKGASINGALLTIKIK